MLHDTHLPHPDFGPQDQIMSMTREQAVKALALVQTAMICRNEANVMIVKIQRITQDPKLIDHINNFVSEASYLLEYKKALQLRIAQLDKISRDFSVTYTAERA